MPIIENNDDIANILLNHFSAKENFLQTGDILIIAHTIISRAEGKEKYLPSVNFSPIAEFMARKTGKDASLVELIIRESEKLMKIKNGLIISKTKHGWICANAAIDQSNAKPGHAVLLPDDSSKSAKRIGEIIEKEMGINISILVSDTHGRALRRGAINVAIGSYNFAVIDDAKGRKDLFGYPLKSTIIALADEICCAAELLMGQANEGIPVVLIRGFVQRSNVSSIEELQYSDEQRLFN